MTDAVRAISESAARFGGGSYMQSRWDDLIHPAPPVETDDRPAEEIAAEIWTRAKIGKKGG